MTRFTLRPMPSPNHTNRERMFILKLGSGPKGALDAKRRVGDESEPDLGELHRAIDELMCEHLSGDGLQTARDALDNLLNGAGRKYDRAHEDGEETDETEDEEEPAGLRAKLTDFLKRDDVTDEDIVGFLNKMPRNGRESGAGGRLNEQEGRDRKARDRRMAADEAFSSFDAMFPNAARIRNAL